MKKPYLILNFKSFTKISPVYLKILRRTLTYFFLDYKIINLPTSKKKITLLKSPHVYKKAREQFQVSTHKIAIYIYSKVNVVDLLKYLTINKPKFIKLSIRKMI
jgi:ribosomal protein S10